MSSAGFRSSQWRWGFCTDQHGGIVVQTVCDPLLLLNGLCNNRSHSSPAGLCSHGQLLYLCGQTCCVRVCLHVHVKFVQKRRVFCVCPQRARLSVCGLALHCDHSVTRGASRGWTHPLWHRYGSTLGNPFICCHTRWPPSTTHIEKRWGKKTNYRQPSGANTGMLFYYY